MSTPRPKPWERQPDEADERWRAFTAYRDMDKRSLRLVAIELGYTDQSLVSRWSMEDGWVVRVRAWDNHLDQIALRQREIEAREAAKRHAELARDGLKAAALPIQALLADRKVLLENGGFQTIPRLSDLEQMETDDLVRLVRGIARLVPGLVGVERISRDQPTAIIHGQGDGGEVAEAMNEDRAETLLEALDDMGLLGAMRREDQDAEEEGPPSGVEAETEDVEV